MNHTLGPYQLVRRLAAGGMGEVLLARFRGDADIGPGLVVLKRCLGDASSRAHPEAMLREEARLAVRLRHENLVETFRLDEVVDEGARTPLLVMEYLAGRSLAQVLGDARRNQAPLPLSVCVQVLRAAACGLHFAHTLREGDRPLGLVHRDVSPANVFVTFDGRVKVIDFGVAKADDSELRTSTGILKGKIGYMSPEHAKGDVLDPRSDLWSLGVVFWEMLVAERLFAGPNPALTLHRITSDEIPSPRARRPEIPRPLEELCYCLLTREKAGRVQSGRELVELIDQLPPLDDTDLGATLAARFPEEAAQGRAEAREAARLCLRAPMPRGLCEGGAPILEGAGGDEDDAGPTELFRRSTLEETIPAAPPEDVDDAPTAIVPPQAATRMESPRMEPPRMEPPRLEPPRTDARAPRSARPAAALPELLPVEGTGATAIDRRPRAPLPEGLPRVEGMPSSVALPAAPPPAPTGPGALTVALLTFGLIAAAMGGVFALLAERRAPPPTYLAVAHEGSLVIVARRADLPPGVPGDKLGQLDPRAPPAGLGVPPEVLAQKLAESGLPARARLPETTRAKVAAALPLGISALGLLALAIAVPGLLRARAQRIALRIALLLSLIAAGGYCAKRGALGWPGTDALAPPGEVPRVVLRLADG